MFTKSKFERCLAANDHMQARSHEVNERNGGPLVIVTEGLGNGERPGVAYGLPKASPWTSKDPEGPPMGPLPWWNLHGPHGLR